MASPVFFSIAKLGMDNQVQEPGVQLHPVLQGSRQVMRWESGNLSFDLAESFTHNPRLVSPSNFRSPSDAEVPSFTNDLISFRDSLALEILGPGHHKLSDESTTGKNIDSVTVETPAYSIPIQVQEADASPRSLPQMLNSDHQLMFFPETTFITTTDDGEDDERDVSNASDSASSKLNWSLSACFSSDDSREHSGSSSSDRDSDGSSPEVFAKRRRKRRKTALPSSSPSSSRRASREDSLPDTHFGSHARLSQCSEEVSGILANAPVTPNFHDSDAECSSGSSLSTNKDCSTAEDTIRGSLFQPLSTKIKYDHSVRQNTTVRDSCSKPKPRRITENLNQNEPYSISKNVHSDKLFKKFTQREEIWEKENVKGSLFRPRNPHNLTRHRIPVRGCNFNNTKADSKLNSPTSAFDDAWPALLKTDQYTSDPKERLLRDPAVLTVGEVVQRTQWPNKNRNTSGKAWFRLENVSDLFNSGKEPPAAVFQLKMEQLLRSNNKSAFGTLLEDPAVLYACRDNGQSSTDHHHQHRASHHHMTLRGNHALTELIVWAACGNTSLPNDPAIIAVGKPLLPAHSGLTTSAVQF